MVKEGDYGLFHLEPDDQRIKPTGLWENTDIKGKKEGSGCPLACVYCNQQFLDTDKNTGEKLAGTIEYGIDGGVAVNDQVMVGKDVVMKADQELIARQLSESPYFSPQMAVMIRNISDPGTNWDESIKLAKLVDKHTGHTGPTVFITKWSVTERNAEAMNEYKKSGGKPVVFVTYSGLPKEIEPASANQRLEAVRRFAEKDIPVVVSMRPMIEGINTDEETIHQVIKETHKYASMYIVGGLYVYPDTAELFKKAGYPLSELYLRDGYSTAKILQPNLRRKVREIARSIDPAILVYDHSSCSTAAIATTVYNSPSYDSLPHWSTPEGYDFDNCAGYCLPEQIAVCKQRTESKSEVVNTARQVLDRIGHNDKEILISDHQPNTLLVKDGILTFQELITIMRETGWRVDNLPNREGMLHRLNQAFERDLRVGLDKLKGLIQVGQQWYLFVDGNVDGTYNNVNTLRFSRSATRARIPHTYNTQILSANMVSELATFMASESLRPDEIQRVEKEINEILNK